MNLKSLVIPEGNVVRIACDGITLWKKSKLPIGYTEIAYIGTTGSGSGSSGSGQYIDTGFRPNQDSRIVCEAMYKGGSNMYGARYAVSSRNFSMRVINGAWQIGYGDGVLTGPIPFDTTEWHIFDHNKNQLYVDGELAAEREYQEFSAPYAAAIGAIHGTSMYYGQGLYRVVKAYDNGVLARDYLSCLNPDGEAGMYEFVENKFYGNAGTGEFIAGPKV